MHKLTLSIFIQLLISFIIGITHCQDAFCQDKTVLIKGTVQDKTTGEFIPFASIRLHNTSYGTASGPEGEFSMTLAAGLFSGEQYLLISCVGYQAARILVSSINPSEAITIYLNPDTYVLREIEIQSKKPLTAREIVKKAFAAIPGNYAAQPYILHTFYRNYCQEENLCRLIEADADIYDPKGHKRLYLRPAQKVQVRINQLRRSLDFTQMYPNHDYVNIYGALQLDHTSYKNSLRKADDDYQFSIQDTLYNEDQPVYVIAYRHLKKKTGRDHQLTWQTAGALHIGAHDFAILKISRNQNNQYINKEADTANVHNYAVIHYKKQGKTYFLDQVVNDFRSYKMEFDPVTNKKVQKNHDTRLQLVVTGISSDTITPFEGKQPKGQTLGQFPLDSTFWASNTTVTRFPVTEEIRVNLEKDRPLADQFKLMAGKSSYKPIFKQEYIFTRADTLRGMLTPLRTCFDVKYYHLDVEVNPADKSIAGACLIRFGVVNDFDRMQIDLYKNMKIEKITFGGKKVKFEREYNAVFVQFPKQLKKGDTAEIVVHYQGKPQELDLNFRWTGGFLWKQDQEGNPWVTVVCQGLGASLWWPNKDHLSDEPDSMLISVTVPEGLMNVSNGRLRKQENLPGGRTRFDWFVSEPINNYNVTLNVGKYMHFSDSYINIDTLSLDYYVMPYHLEKAKQYTRQVKPMLTVFEQLFGKYPFYADGFKLVESVYVGMEHQSAVAIGNAFKTGWSLPEQELDFDPLLIHESVHEWWGNSVSMQDIADMWIHEAFATYAEALYVEQKYGYAASLDYLNMQEIIGEEPIQGKYHVNHVFYRDDDMYTKGAFMLNTLRHVINNDKLWFDILKNIPAYFRHQTISTRDVVQYINRQTGTDYTYFFDQYLNYTAVPVLEVNLEQAKNGIILHYRWQADVPGFRMPVKVTASPGNFDFIHPTTSWKSMPIKNITAAEFEVAEDRFFVQVKQVTR